MNSCLWYFLLCVITYNVSGQQNDSTYFVNAPWYIDTLDHGVMWHHHHFDQSDLLFPINIYSISVYLNKLSPMNGK
ncbi:MAG: hypothetical protein IPJ13_01310 [Saprospiraceae bacterium]|nr:hypothetical protein [Saprospiraceae bacterium]